MFEVGLAHAHPDEPEHVEPGGGGGATEEQSDREREAGGGRRRLCNRSVVTASQTHVTASSVLCCRCFLLSFVQIT